MSMKTYNNYIEEEVKQDKKQFVITGVDANGKRFKPIKTNTPQHYNIYKGSLWKIKEDGKRKLVKRYF